MKKTIFTYLLISALIISAFYPLACQAQVQSPSLLWTNPMEVNDVAVSRDGNYIAAVNDTGLYFFSSSNSVPIWWWLTQANCPVISVAISGEGGYVAIGTWNFTYNDGNLHYFANSRSRAGLQPSFTWQSVGIGDPVFRGTFDMSDNGDYIALVGSGNSLYYFINCRTRSGSSEASTWNFLSGGFAESVDLSSDGRYVAFGGSTPVIGGFVAFCKDAFSLPYPTAPLWSKDVLSPVWEVAVSDDGFAVAAVTSPIDGADNCLYYWKNAKSLSGNPPADWEYDVPLMGVDASSDGERIVAFSGWFLLRALPPQNPSTLYFWDNGRQRIDGTPDWIRLESEIVSDAAISGDGSLIAAITVGLDENWLYFYDSAGNLVGAPFELSGISDKISISEDGATVAVAGAEGVPHTLYAFRIKTVFPAGGEISPANISNLVGQQIMNATPYLLLSVAVFAGLIIIVARRRSH